MARTVRAGPGPGKEGPANLPFMMIPSRYRDDLPALVLLASAGAAVIAVHLFASPHGGMRLTRAGGGDGLSEIRTGDASYPRQAVDSDNFAVRIAKPARRIASQYWSIDEFVYAVVPPERVIAVSESAYLQRISNVYQHVQRFKPAVATDPERVLRQMPDLMMVSNGARVDFCDLVRSANIPIYRAFTMFTTLEQVAETIRLTGYLTSEDKRADQEVKRFWDEIGRAQSRRPSGARPPRILGTGGRYGYGDQTLFDDIVRKLGGINVGAEGGLHGYNSVSSEQIVRWDPEWIVAAADPGTEKQVLAKLLEDPAIALTHAARKGQVLVLPQNVFLPMSPFTTLLVTAMAEAIYE